MSQEQKLAHDGCHLAMSRGTCPPPGDESCATASGWGSLPEDHIWSASIWAAPGQDGICAPRLTRYGCAGRSDVAADRGADGFHQPPAARFRRQVPPIWQAAMRRDEPVLFQAAIAPACVVPAPLAWP